MDSPDFTGTLFWKPGEEPFRLSGKKFEALLKEAQAAVNSLRGQRDKANDRITELEIELALKG